MGSANIDTTKTNQWQRLSWRNVRSSWTDNQTAQFRFDFEGMAENTIAYIDDAMLIDLTAAFGAGNEPTQEWCDTNIGYFAGDTIIQYEAPDTYDLTITAPTRFKAGDILNCPYSGSAKSIALPKGQYKLECWGAQGGYRSSANYGGKGGYSAGTIVLTEKTLIYLYSGGAGNTGKTNGGFNGGGKRSGYNGGGGASDIRIGTDSLYARIIVAGGGGSDGATFKTGMYGGGVTGGSSSESYGTGGYGGTQTGVSSSSWQTTSQSTSTTTQAGAYSGFGFGGNGIYYSSGYGGAGGGGWYGGSGTYPDSSNDDDKGGGGGSGYVYTSSTASNYPSGCLLNSQYYLENATTLAGNTAFTSPTGTSETGHTGDGYIRITVIEAQGGNTLIKVPQTLPSTYTQLDYLQFTGAQYINTGVIVDGNTGFDITFEVLNGQSSSPYYNLFGVRGNDSSGGSSENQNFFRIDTIPVDSSSGTEFKYASTVYNSGITGTSKINIKLLNKVYTKPDESTITVSGDITSGLAMYIGCINKDNTAYGNKASMKLYRFKIYNSSTLTHDYIPVQRVSDKVLGLYDLTTSTFKTNAASGIPFTSNLMNDSASLIYFNGDSLSSQGNESLTITNNNVTLSSEQTHFNKNSLKFDGSSSYMYMPFPSTYAGDITIEGWFYQTSNNNSSYPTPFTLISSAGRGFYMHRLSNQTFVAATASNSWPGLSGGTTTLNTWTHIAMCLSSAATTTYCFIDGKLMGTLADTNTSYVGLTLGTLASSTSDNHSSGCYFQGYISELKVTKGCKWTKDFTLPTKPYETSNNSPWKNAKQIFINTGASSTIPSGLVELEYIQSSGTQYINTNILGQDISKVNVDFQFTSVPSGAEAQIAAIYVSSTVYFQIGWSGSSFMRTSEYTYSQTANSLARTQAEGTPTGRPNYTLWLFGQNETGTLKHPASAKIYSCKIYDNNNTLVRDFIPIKTTTNIYGLWDKVTKAFYPNTGTGAFTGGPAITLTGWHKIKGVWAKTAADTWSQTL